MAKKIEDLPPLSQKRSRITKEVTKIGSDVIPQKGQIRTIRVYSPFEEEKAPVITYKKGAAYWPCQ